jgi:hypothetical protein
MYGYQENVSYANVATCRVNPCTGKVSIQKTDDLDKRITLAYSSNNSVRSNTNSGNSSGGNNKKTSSNALSRAQSEANSRGKANGGVASVSGNGNRATVTYKNGKSETFTTDSSNGNSCSLKTHYGFTKNVTNNAVGQKVTTTPPSWPQSQAGITAVSGNVYGGLFCAASATGAQCDAHGTSQTEGQTGSGFAQTCKFFSCSPAIPAGPQQVVTTGWLAGKAVSQLSTGSTGYTCAIASGSVGCWGVNTKGQLGVGDKKTKNIPTEVGL